MIKEITFYFDKQCKLTCPYNDLTIEEISSDYIVTVVYTSHEYPEQELTINLEMTNALMEIFANSNLSSHIKEIEWIDSLGRKRKQKVRIKHSSADMALGKIYVSAAILYELPHYEPELSEPLKPLQSKVKPINIENENSNVIVW